MQASIEATQAPSITREQEQRLYKFLQIACEDDALRYQLIAQKVHRTADNTATLWESSIAVDWLNCMLELEAIRAKTNTVVDHLPREEPFAAVRAGKVGNPKYQAFLDTLEEDQLQAITSNVDYFAWFSQRQASVPKGEEFSREYLRRWADANLSERVKRERDQMKSANSA